MQIRMQDQQDQQGVRALREHPEARAQQAPRGAGARVAPEDRLELLERLGLLAPRAPLDQRAREERRALLGQQEQRALRGHREAQARRAHQGQEARLVLREARVLRARPERAEPLEQRGARARRVPLDQRALRAVRARAEPRALRSAAMV